MRPRDHIRDDRLYHFHVLSSPPVSGGTRTQSHTVWFGPFAAVICFGGSWRIVWNNRIETRAYVDLTYIRAWKGADK